MSEIGMGMTLPEYFTAVVRSKVARLEVRRDLLLCGVKVKAEEAVVKGLVDIGRSWVRGSGMVTGEVYEIIY
ncbi:hypothetical protein OSB04_003696 [Centaurea solstitialis]|uniref:Uncharacterized protein n=1 Tax=Centaurea solstitialis TaxID=347529 RepID=A0AA38TX55_9ASTR|nr:hypothetical protein OSB04_003695 [Centaurea solstitialis]KAJ9567730.1 hypothetical protein OSB04_003696 [Centaurea solstitialis]